MKYRLESFDPDARTCPVLIESNYLTDIAAFVKDIRENRWEAITELQLIRNDVYIARWIPDGRTGLKFENFGPDNTGL